MRVPLRPTAFLYHSGAPSSAAPLYRAARHAYVKAMKHLVLSTALIAALAVPGPAPAEDEGLGLGLEDFLDGFRRDLDPLLRDFAEEVEPQLRGFVAEMGPLLATLADLIGDYNQYHAPEKLPNGDIIIRRRTPEEMRPQPESEPAPDGQIDL